MVQSIVTITHPISKEVFTFNQGMIESIRTTFNIGIEQEQLTGSGPMGNQGIDDDGVGKNIVITGRFIDSPDNSVTSVNNIRSKLMMKYWFESIASGAQLPVKFTSYNDTYSSMGASNSDFPVVDEVSGATINLEAEFIETNVYFIGFEVSENEGDLEEMPFTITLWVAGL